MSGRRPLDDLYFEWLYKFFGSVKNRDPEKGYWNLARRLHSTEFLYFVPNDSNRAADGRDLRYEFLDQAPYGQGDAYFMDENCSVLEMLIALARKAYLITDDGTTRSSVGVWFWKMMSNIRLDHLNDADWSRKSLGEIDRTIKRVLDRTYSQSGVGGLFPLQNWEKDQRDVELWYQLNTYLLDRGYVNPDPYDSIF